MNRGTTVLIVLMMIAVPLAGCAGGDLEQQISDLEAAADVDQATIDGLESSAEADAATISALEGQVASLEAQIAANGDVTELEQYNAQLISENTQLQMDLDNSPTQADVDDAYQQGLLAGGDTSTLDVILARGTMKCGVKESQYGMGYLDAATGVRSGLDISYCRAVAAAIGLDPDTDVEYVPASGSDRFEKLASGVIDVLIRTTTWTTSRDASLNADFAGMNFFDGQGILIREDRFAAAAAGNSAAGLDGANICVGIGTTTEGNMQDWFSSREIDFTSVPVADAAEATAKFIDGSCDAFTGDMSAMVAKKWQLDTDGSMNGVDIWIASELMSKEPLGAATRDYDSEWNEIVAWVWYGMITAEEMGVTSGNYAAMATQSCAINDAGSATDPGMCRLLTQNLGLGTATNPLPANWGHLAIKTVGNYGEVYDRAFCDGNYDGTSGSSAMVDCILNRAGTLNALVSEGGVMYAPAMR